MQQFLFKLATLYVRITSGYWKKEILILYLSKTYLEDKLNLTCKLTSFRFIKIREKQKMATEEKGKQEFSRRIVSSIKQQSSANVYVTNTITISPRSHFFLPVTVKGLKEKQSAFLYISFTIVH